jgi:hypothetical protein
MTKQNTGPVWRVRTIESDRFSGQKLLKSALYEDEQKAKDDANLVNSQNVGQEVPDYYIFAIVDQVS